MNRRLPILLIQITVLLCVSKVFAADNRVWVDRAVDGDTIRLRSGALVRYLGIDAPEIDHRARKSEPYGYDALDLNRRLVEGKRIRLHPNMRKKDRFGRLLAHPVDETGRMINLLILEHGLACYYPHPDKKSRALQTELLAAQRRAMKKRVGIWSRTLKDNGQFIGNRRSLRFHTTTCPYGQQTALKNRSVFRLQRDAYWQGYAPCRQCLASPIKKGLKRR